MKIENNVNLKSKNTFHINGIVKNLYIPENENDLINIIKMLKDKKYYILSGGSNILINDKIEYENIIYMSDVDKEITLLDNKGKFYIGASNRIQNVIKEINKNNYGGIEKLYSLPALFGGIIYMNAGIGGRNNSLFTISDFIIRVKVLNKDNKEIEWLNKEDCEFSHRNSLFHNNKYIILGAECQFKEQNIEASKKAINDRINTFSRKADMGKGTFGTVFSISSSKLLNFVSILYCRKGEIRFGKNKKNWLVNEGNGTYEDAIFLINKVKKWHKLFHQEVKCEVIIWGEDNEK